MLKQVLSRIPVAVFSSIFLLSVPSSGQTPNCLGSSASDNAAAREELNRGVESYKAARYAEAIDHFQKASNIAPCLTMARSYLATAQAQNVVPGLDTPDNLKTADASVENFKLVLAQNQHDINSLKQVAAVYFSTKRFDDAREWQKKVLVEDPNDYEAAYTIGVIDWTQAHTHALAALTVAGLSISRQNRALIEEGLQYLTRAIEGRPNYDDAMAYLNLVYRRKADLDYQNPALRDEDVAKAKDWAHKAMQTRKENEQKKMASPDPAQP
jgi:tetratricopeptide (TPR) repeat protein